MKRKFIAVIAACVVLCMAGAFASCNHEHKFGEWVTVTEATCTKGGVRERTCRCGEREAEAIDALGHDYQNGVCTRCGEEQPPTDNAFFAFLSQGNGCYSIKAAPGKLLPETVVLPSEYEGGAVTEILPSGFWRGNMRTVFIPDSYTNIANEAFSGCDALEEVTAEGPLDQLGDNAFYGCSTLERALFEDGVKRVGNGVFGNCTALTEVRLGEGTEILSGELCVRCPSLKEIVLPDSVTQFWKCLARECESLERISIGSGLKSISGIDGMPLASDCPAFSRVEVDPENPLFSGEGNCLVRKEDGLLIAGGKDSVIPADGSVREIGYGAFSGTAIARAEIPAGVVRIGDNAFLNCTALAKVSFPAGLTEIGGYAFAGCGLLAEIALPEGLSEIGDYAFWGTAIGTLRLPESLSQIGFAVFSDCTNLKTAYVPGVKNVGGRMFEDCTALEEVTIGEGAVDLGSSLFSGCTALRSVTLPESAVSVGDECFSGCTSLAEIEWGSPLIMIGWNAFRDCVLLREVSIGASAYYVGPGAFLGCESLEAVYFAETEGWTADREPIDPALLADPQAAAQLLKENESQIWENPEKRDEWFGSGY